MRSIDMKQNIVFIMLVKSISTYMVPAINDKNTLTKLAGNPLSQCGTSETCTNN